VHARPASSLTGRNNNSGHEWATWIKCREADGYL
jgi:hypothetical protein